MKDRMIIIRGTDVLIISIQNPSGTTGVQTPDPTPLIVKTGDN